MKFGPVPLDKAVGAILAHSVNLNGKRLRKAQVLAAGVLPESVSAEQGRKMNEPGSGKE